MSVKQVLVAGGMLSYIVSSAVLRRIPADPRIRARRLAHNTHAYARWFLRVLGVTVELENAGRLEGPRYCGRLFVANHVSYLDPVAIASIAPCLFVTSVEVRDGGFVGVMARAAGSLFVERRRPLAVGGETDLMARWLKEGFDVVLFPEGTTSDGTSVLPFKSALLESAARVGAEIVPLCLNYAAIDGRPFQGAERDRVFYYGDMTFLPHFQRLLEVRSLALRLIVGEPVSALRVPCRKALAARTRETIEAYHVPIA